MAIGIPQIGLEDLNDVDLFSDPEEENEINTSVADPEMDLVRQRLAMLEEAKPSLVPDFDASYNRYLNILKPLTQDAPRPSIYDLASSLSKGLTAQAQSGAPPSIGFGLAAGFNDFSDYARARKQADFDQMQSMTMQAGTLAIQDVQAGEKLYQQLLSQQVLRDPDKMGSAIRYAKIDPDTKKITAIKIIGSNDYITQQRYSEMGYELIADPKPPSTIMDMTGTIGKAVEEKTWGQLSNDVHEAGLKSEAAIINNQSLAKFSFLQDQIDPDEFGRGAALVGAVKEYLNDVPIVGDYISDRNISARQALKNTQMGFVLEIVGPYKGAISNKELDVFQQSVASIANEKEANNFILITSKRANQVAMNYSEAYMNKYRELYNRFMEEEITGADAQYELQKFKNEWGADDNLNSMIFTPEVRAELAESGFANERIVDNRGSAKSNYQAQLISQYELYRAEGIEGYVGLTDDDLAAKAKIDTDDMFGGIDEFTTFHNGYVNNLNSQTSSAGGSTGELPVINLN